MSLKDQWSKLSPTVQKIALGLLTLALAILILQIRGCVVSGSKAAYWKGQFDSLYSKYTIDEKKIVDMNKLWDDEKGTYDGEITGLNGVIGNVQTENEKLTEANAIKANEIRALRAKAVTDMAAKDSLIKALDERIVIMETQLSNCNKMVALWEQKFDVKDREFKTLELHYADLNKAYLSCGESLKVANITIKWQATRIKSLEFQCNLGKVGITVGVVAGLFFLLKK